MSINMLNNDISAVKCCTIFLLLYIWNYNTYIKQQRAKTLSKFVHGVKSMWTNRGQWSQELTIY